MVQKVEVRIGGVDVEQNLARGLRRLMDAKAWLRLLFGGLP